ncbi:hypothetical protein PHYPSEUDO_001480 [Phytophthora pseudosyringae]|uniref:Uncharacterized protein n=1 Tax=Phytophthora pseudosyringae TaxID=221518 RepID=A0A8T1W0H6_9STRA|nr:hypothetical protein PHYPSEUDO_001480 [Phytophthora pseudosyringae]
MEICRGLRSCLVATSGNNPNPPGAPVASGPNPSRRRRARGLGWLLRAAQVGSNRNLRASTHLSAPLQSIPTRKTMPPKPATKDANDAQKQRQTNLEIDLLKSAWIQKDRESPPGSGKK